MDVNQTRFHLLYGPDDWGRCNADGSDQPLAAQWQAHQDPALEWDEATQTLRLTRTVPLFRRAKRTPPLESTARRGAAQDRYGNWYWIDAAETGVRFLPSGDRRSQPFWQLDDLSRSCAPADAGAFAPKLPPSSTPGHLRGLAVTTHHYLVVGDLDQHGLWVFDLHGGGAPLLLRWPAGVDFAPWDLAATPGGGVLVLDQDHLCYWVLDADFRLMAQVAGADESLFQPTSASARRNLEPVVPMPEGMALAPGAAPAPTSPVSIEPGPDGTVFILDTDPDRPYSILYEYAGSTQLAAYSLENAVRVADPDLGEGGTRLFSVAAHDFVHFLGLLGAGGLAASSPQATATEPSVFYLAERDGNQVMAFVLDRSRGHLVDLQEYLPLRRWEGKALVGAGERLYYDFSDRWVPLQPLVECQVMGRAVLTTPIDFSGPSSSLDSGLPGCAWHRLLLDARIPAGTSVAVRARAADEPDLLAQNGWLSQPTPYRRSAGAELPYYDPWAGETQVVEGTGTWELLFQEVRGRYLQLELTLVGTGRSTPALRAARAWFPRFSYLEHYLPAIYREEPGPASFLERWLANFEGFYTNLEDAIEHAAALFDPRTAPPDTLDWLGCWLGVVLDPLWDETKRRFFIQHADRLYRQRGTVPGVLTAVRLYVDAQVDESLFDPACLARGRVRLVEHFRTRDYGGLVYGDPTAGEEPVLRTVTYADVVDAAHRFSVLVPHDLDEEQFAMVDRIISLEKPAHTEFVLKQYWAMFRVGEARLGLDTALGYSSRFEAHELGRTYLADGYLPPPYPFDVEDRLVVPRDRLGDLPAL